MQLEDNAKTAQARNRRALVSLTPLIDVVFILLVFFMLASSFSTEQVIEILAPVDTGPARSEAAGAALVRIRGNGDIDLNGEPLTRSELSQRVGAWSVSHESRRYLVQPDDGVTTQQVVSVLDLLKSSGAGSVSFTRR